MSEFDFYRGTEEKCLNNSGTSEENKDPNGIYFATDSKKIIMAGESYGGSSIYDTKIEDTVAMPTKVGGIAAGTTAADLKGKDISNIIDDLLFPTIVPTISPQNAPTLSLNKRVVLVGSNLSTLVTDVFTPSYDAGKIMLNGNSQGAYAGAYSFNNSGRFKEVTLNAIVLDVNSNNEYQLTENNSSYIFKAEYNVAASENIPVDNKGNTNNENNDVPKQYKGETNKSVTGTIVTTAPVYATTNTSKPANIIEQTLRDHTIASNRTYELTVAKHNPTEYPTTIEVPGTISDFYEQNPGGNFVKDTISKFNITTKAIHGVTYTVYKQKDDSGGERKIKFIFNN